jgi:murein DD-endopeptidase MepM/ murein hydrolase activator NlpD
MSFLVMMLLFILCWSAIVWVLCIAAAKFLPALQQWSGFWGLALLSIVLAPLAGMALSLLPLPYETTILPTLLHDAGFGGDTGPVALPVGESGPDYWVLAMLALGGIYVTGVIFRLADLLLGMRHCRHMVRTGNNVPATETCPAYIASPEETAPFAFGWWRARIVIPASWQQKLTAPQLASIVRHEQAHIERGDPMMITLLKLAECVCWFSPFVRRLIARWHLAAEMECDARALAGQSPEIRKGYAQALLQAFGMSADRVRQYPAATFSTNHLRSEKMRIASIMKATAVLRKSPWQKAGLGLAALALVGVGSTAAAAVVHDTDIASSPAEIVSGKLTARYGDVPDPFNKGKMRLHKGVDIKAPAETPIYAPEDGVIVLAGNEYQGSKAYGNVIVLETKGGIQTSFSHLHSYKVKEGELVRKGQLLARVGNTGRSTGPHVHIETYRNGERVDPMTIWTTLDR